MEEPTWVALLDARGEWIPGTYVRWRGGDLTMPPAERSMTVGGVRIRVGEGQQTRHRDIMFCEFAHLFPGDTIRSALPED